MEAFSALLALCERNFTGEFPSQRPVTQSFDVFFDLRQRIHYDVTVMHAIYAVTHAVADHCLRHRSLQLKSCLQEFLSGQPLVTHMRRFGLPSLRYLKKTTRTHNIHANNLATNIWCVRVCHDCCFRIHCPWTCFNFYHIGMLIKSFLINSVWNNYQFQCLSSHTEYSKIFATQGCWRGTFGIP